MNGVEVSALVGVSVVVLVDGIENSTLTAEASANVASSNGGYKTSYDISSLVPGQNVTEVWTMPDGVGVGTDAVYAQTYIVAGLNAIDLTNVANYLYMRSCPVPPHGHFHNPCCSY